MCCITLLLSYLLYRMEAAILLIGAFWCGNYANLIAANNDLHATVLRLSLAKTRLIGELTEDYQGESVRYAKQDRRSGL